jgi:hypothetical protein
VYVSEFSTCDHRKPLKPIMHMRPDIPIYLGIGDEATVAQGNTRRSRVS